MTDIIITKTNEVWMKVVCSEVYMELDLKDEFRFYVPSSEHDIRFKKGQWDGYKNLYDRRSKRMYIGLLLRLIELAVKRGWKLDIDPDLLPSDESLDIDDIKEIVKSLNIHSNGKPIEPYDYQLDAIMYMLNMGRTVPLAATNAGKSLILYIVIRTYQLLDEFKNKTIFLVVPSTTLVEQMYSDFKDYSTDSKGYCDWHVNTHAQKISGDYAKYIEKQIVIITWQSMIKLPFETYDDIGAIFIDETHTAKASSLVNILERCTYTKYRHGVTGTLDGTECNELVIQGLLGPVKRIITAKETIDIGKSCTLEVVMCLLDHPKHIREFVYNQKLKVQHKNRFQKEIEIVNQLEYRRKFILDFIEAIPGNSIVLFDRVDNYGRELYEAYKLRNENTFLIVGDVKTKDRTDIKDSVETHDDCTIFASFGTMQQGISVNKFHNMFIVSSSKSVIRILQSIGRMMRKHETKDVARIYDLTDDLTYDNQENYVMKHAMERIQMYSNEQHMIKFERFSLSDSKSI
jgi:superfamily II DNA or RNA helicase